MFRYSGFFKRVGLALCFTLVLPSQGVWASDAKNDTRITLDFALRQVQFFGVYAPESGNKRGGLDAEIVARRNGISYLNSKLQGSCGKSVSAADQTTSSPSWQATVKSQGSEIFSNGVLKISLVAPIREIFKDVERKPSVLKTKEGAPIALRLPRLALANLKCGLVNLSVAGKTLAINPLSGSTETGAKVVRLEMASGVLQPATAADASLLEGSNLFASAEPANVDASTNTQETQVSPAPAN